MQTERYKTAGAKRSKPAWTCREVIATEVSKASVGAAVYNIEANGVGNVHVARLSSEEFVKAWRGEREFFRMKELPPVKDRTFQTLLVRICIASFECWKGE